MSIKVCMVNIATLQTSPSSCWRSSNDVISAISTVSHPTHLCNLSVPLPSHCVFSTNMDRVYLSYIVPGRGVTVFKPVFGPRDALINDVVLQAHRLGQHAVSLLLWSDFYSFCI